MPDLADGAMEEVTAVHCQGWGLTPPSGGLLANRATFWKPGREVVWCWAVG
jgi:hypothetical protein